MMRRFASLCAVLLALLGFAGAAFGDGLVLERPARAALGTIAAADLPPEGRRTLDLIRRGGPFPYPKDGSVFGNREGRLPPKPRGYYHEYTVKTAASRDRGAIRIVAGRVGEYYYSNDHYRSFRRIVD